MKLHLQLIHFLQIIIRKQLNMYKEYNAVLKDCYDCVISNEEVKLALTLLQQTLATKEDAVTELKDQYKEAQRVFELYDAEFQPLKREAENLYNEALKTTNGINPQSPAFRSLNKAFEKLPATINDINNELEIANAKVFCMAKNVDAENVSV